MHGWEIRMLLKHYLEQGVSKAELSRRRGPSAPQGESRRSLAKVLRLYRGGIRCQANT